MSALMKKAARTFLLNYTKEQLQQLAACDTGMGEIGPVEAKQQLELIAAIEAENQSSDGGPAFPIPGEGTWLDPKTCVNWSPYHGMSLRDYFAGKAFQAHLSMPETHDILKRGSIKPFELAQAAYEWADAMIAARNGKEPA